MKHKKIIGIGILFAVLVAGFFARELWLGRTQPTQIFAEKNAILVRSPQGKIFFFGEESAAKNAAWNIRPFLLGEKMIDMFSSSVGDEIVNPTFTVQRLSQRFVRGLFSNDLGGRRAAFFFFDENFSEDELRTDQYSSYAVAVGLVGDVQKHPAGFSSRTTKRDSLSRRTSTIGKNQKLCG